MLLAIVSGLILAQGQGAGSALVEPGKKIALLPTQLDDHAKEKVPGLFDDILLTSVQNQTQREVIGRDDINAMLGFEEQKDILGCDDASCLADIGGALGVDYLIAFKVALLGESWAVTSKLMDLRAARVAARTSDFVNGDTTALLQAVPTLVAELLGTRVSQLAVERPQAPPPTAPPVALAVATPPVGPAPQPDPAMGKGLRTFGWVFWGIGMAASAVSIGMAASAFAQAAPPTFGFASSYTGARLGWGSALAAVGTLFTGIGSGRYMNGRARMIAARGDVSGHAGYRWVPWVTGFVVPAYSLAMAFSGDDRAGRYGSIALIAGTVITQGLFTLTMHVGGYGRTEVGQEFPLVSSVSVAPLGLGRYTPTFNAGLAW